MQTRTARSRKSPLTKYNQVPAFGGTFLSHRTKSTQFLFFVCFFVFMSKIFQEFGFSLVIGDGNWIGASHETEYSDGTKIRKWGIIRFSLSEIQDIYLRIWIYKTVFIFTKQGMNTKKKDKIGLKCIFGFSFCK